MKLSKKDKEEFKSYCLSVTVAQLRNVIIKEKKANRKAYQRIAEQALVEREIK